MAVSREREQKKAATRWGRGQGAGESAENFGVMATHRFHSGESDTRVREEGICYLFTVAMTCDG